MGGIQQPGYAKGTFKRHYFNKSYFSLHCPFLRGSFAHLGLAQSQNARTAVYVCVFVCVCVCVCMDIFVYLWLYCICVHMFVR